MTDIPRTQFPHYRLDAHEVSMQMLLLAKTLADSVPRGYRQFADQLLRAAGAVVGGITEGANRRTPAQKRDAFGRARGEAGEAAGHAEALARMGLVDSEVAVELIVLADRTAAMLTGLMKRQK